MTNFPKSFNTSHYTINSPLTTNFQLFYLPISFVFPISLSSFINTMVRVFLMYNLFNFEQFFILFISQLLTTRYPFLHTNKYYYRASISLFSYLTFNHLNLINFLLKCLGALNLIKVNQRRYQDTSQDAKEKAK